MASISTTSATTPAQFLLSVFHKEVPTPAYEAMLDNAPLGRRALEILMNRISTRHYQQVLPAMAETVGVSKSAVNR